MSRILTHLQPFQGNEHQPFHWSGGRAAALLVHGFPGTPAEMRPLGTALYQDGWTVHGLLLPGFGPQIETIFERDYTEWVVAVESTLAALQQKHRPVLLMGHSMGAAVSIQAAVSHPPHGLVLMAPFWQLGEWWQRWIGQLLKPLFRQIRPFKNVDFADPQMRQGIVNFLPGIDLDNSEVQEEIREFAIPLRVFEQLHQVGKTAFRLATQVDVPTLVIQGTQDETVPVARTRRLLQRLRGPLCYQEVKTGHALIHPEDPGWPYVEQAVLAFGRSFFAESIERSDNGRQIPVREKTI